MSNPYDVFRKVINHEANQDDDGGFFAKLGGIQPESNDDGPTAKGLFQHMSRDNGGKLPAGLDYFHNLLSPPGPFMRLLKRKRKPIVKVRREVISNSYGTLTRWNWSCRICGLGRAQSGWWIAYDTADRHARQHESREPCTH